MKFRPLNDRITVDELDPARVSAGGVILANPENRLQREGVVTAVGRGLVTNGGEVLDFMIEVGDTVVYNVQQAQVIDVGGKPVTVLRGADVIGVIEK